MFVVLWQLNIETDHNTLVDIIIFLFYLKPCVDQFGFILY